MFIYLKISAYIYIYIYISSSYLGNIHEQGCFYPFIFSLRFKILSLVKFDIIIVRKIILKVFASW